MADAALTLPTIAAPTPAAPATSAGASTGAEVATPAGRFEAAIASAQAKAGAPTSPVANDAPGEAPAGEAPKKNDFQTSLANLRESRQLSAQRKALARQAAEVRPQVEEARRHQELRSAWREKGTAAYLEAVGIPIEDFSKAHLDYMLNNKAPPPPDPIELKVKEQIKPIQEELEKERAERSRMQELHAKASWISQNVRPLIDPEKHETLIRMQGGVDNASVYAFNIIEAHHQKTGEVVDVATALAQIENHFGSELENAVNEAMALKRLKSRFAPLPAAAPPATRPVNGATRIAPTLTNNQSPGATFNSALRNSATSGDWRESRNTAALAKYGLK